MINNTLEKLGLKDDEIKTFIFLLENGEQTAGNLAKKSGLSRPSLYGFLKKLKEIGLVAESQKNGIKTFHSNSQEQIQTILDERIKDLENGKSDIERIFTNLNMGTLTTIPKFQIFEGQKEIRGILRDILLHRNIETISCMPIKSAIEVAGEDFFRELNIGRIKRNIYVRALWPHSQSVSLEKHPYMGNGKEFLREIRMTPPDIEYEMGYWVYGSKALFLSSKKERVGFIIESPELVQLLKTQFEFIWASSKPFKDSSAAPMNFLKKERLI